MIDTDVHVIDASRFPPPDGPGTKPWPDERATAADLAGVLALRTGEPFATEVENNLMTLSLVDRVYQLTSPGDDR